jgi:hypothetical protein
MRDPTGDRRWRRRLEGDRPDVLILFEGVGRIGRIRSDDVNRPGDGDCGENVSGHRNLWSQMSRVATA